MHQDYQELIDKVSQQIAQTFLEHETNVAHRALLVDADIAKLTQQIGLKTAQIVLEQSREQLVKKSKQQG